MSQQGRTDIFAGAGLLLAGGLIAGLIYDSWIPLICLVIGLSWTFRSLRR